MDRTLLLLPLFLFSQYGGCGFIEGEPCNIRNTALLNPTRPVWPMEQNNIKCLDMRNMGKTSWLKHVRNNLPYLKKVRTVFADSMMLGRIPQKVIGFLPHLELLDVTNNRIRRIHPLTFANNSNFNTLILTSNRVALPLKRPLLISKSIKTLYLSKNYIKGIPLMAFNQLPSLRELFLDSNELLTINPAVFRNLHNLKMLHLGNNLLTQIPPKEAIGSNLVLYITKSNPRIKNDILEDFA